jgi:sialic acid synthase SpsE
MDAKGTYVIAEMACSHDGDPRLARAIVDAAGEAEAQAVQFQIWSRTELMAPHHPAAEVLDELELSPRDWEELRAYTAERFPQMEVVACVYEIKSLGLTERLSLAAYKIHSGDIGDRAHIEAVASTGKRVHLCVGASSPAEVERAIGWIRARSRAPVWLLHGYQAFPTRTDDVHLRHLEWLLRRFELPVGYQDHSDAESEAAFWLPAAAVGMGVPILEKHLTHDRSRRGADHQAALNPGEFRRFMEMIRTIERARGNELPLSLSPERLRYREGSRKTVVAARALEAGTRLSAEHLNLRRAPEGDFAPDQLESLYGRVLRRALDPLVGLRKGDLR